MILNNSDPLITHLHSFRPIAYTFYILLTKSCVWLHIHVSDDIPILNVNKGRVGFGGGRRGEAAGRATAEWVGREGL